MSSRLLHGLKQTVVAIDQLINALFGGWADETLSARSYRLEGKRTWAKIARPIIDIIFFFEPEHCYESYRSEVLRRHLPVEYRR